MTAVLEALDKDLEALADDLADAAHRRQPIAPIAERLRGEDMDQAVLLDRAYAVQARVANMRIAAGARRVGRKIGLTARSVQRQLGVDSPDFGALFDTMAFADGEELPPNFIAPRAEGELALVLARDIVADNPSIADVIAATDFALPAIEVCDSRIADWRIALLDTVADNASAGAFVLGGSPVSLRRLDPRAIGMRMSRNGELVSEGIGEACLGNPITAATWLAREMARRSDPLRGGDIILTGALGPMVAVEPGDRFEATFEGLGTVSFSLGISRDA